MIEKLIVIGSSPQSMLEWTGQGSASKEGREHAMWFVREVQPTLEKLGLAFDPVSSHESYFSFKKANAKPGLELKVVQALEKKFRVTFTTGVQNALKVFQMNSTNVVMGSENPYFAVERWRSGTVGVHTIIGWKA
jgi:hypothetical protein